MSEETFTTNIGGCDPSDCASCTSDCSGAGQAIPRVPNPTIKLTLEDDSVLDECPCINNYIYSVIKDRLAPGNALTTLKRKKM